MNEETKVMDNQYIISDIDEQMMLLEGLECLLTERQPDTRGELYTQGVLTANSMYNVFGGEAWYDGISMAVTKVITKLKDGLAKMKADWQKHCADSNVKIIVNLFTQNFNSVKEGTTFSEDTLTKLEKRYQAVKDDMEPITLKHLNVIYKLVKSFKGLKGDALKGKSPAVIAAYKATIEDARKVFFSMDAVEKAVKVAEQDLNRVKSSKDENVKVAKAELEKKLQTARNELSNAKHLVSNYMDICFWYDTLIVKSIFEH